MNNETPIEKLYGTKKIDGTMVGRILVKPENIETAIGGFKIPEVDQNKDKPESGRIVMVSDEVTHLKPGDLILHNRFAGVKFEHDNQKYIVISSDDAYAKIKEQK